MQVLLLLLAFLAPAFWETKAPAQWSDEEVDQLLHDSPWAQAAASSSRLGSTGIQVYLATALPAREAEAELIRRRPKDFALDPDYLDYLRENRGKSIILAVHLPNVNALSDAKEARKMEEESIMKVGRKKYKMTGHFPPTSMDPYLRLVYPREVSPADKKITFELYLPSLQNPFREAEFSVRELVYKGKPEF